MSLGEAYRQRGDWAHAIASLDRSQRITAERDFRLMTSWVETRLGIACVAAGQVARGLQLLRSAASNVDAGKKDVRYSLVIRLLGEGCSLTGAIAEARACATEALAVAKTLGLRGDQAAAQCLLAQVSDAAGLVEDSQLGFATALELASLLRMRPLVAHCQFGLGSLYHRTGRRHRAEEHLTTAATMYRAMGMTYWLEQTEAEATGLA
jgi:tetratricopeptide (TPR) repeat protein